MFSAPGLTQGTLFSEKIINPFFSYNMQSEKDYRIANRNKKGDEIDLYNVCRVQQCSMKSVTVYVFTSPKDSSMQLRHAYFRNGINKNFVHRKFTYQYISPEGFKFDCTEFEKEPERKPRRTTIRFRWPDMEVTTKRYDSLGYMIEHSTVQRGILMRFIIRLVDGSYPKRHRYYEYSDNYRRVKAIYCSKRRLSSKTCSTELITYYEFDERENLLSEMRYRYDEQGNLIFKGGEKYLYQYFKKQE